MLEDEHLPLRRLRVRLHKFFQQKEGGLGVLGVMDEREQIREYFFYFFLSKLSSTFVKELRVLCKHPR